MRKLLRVFIIIQLLILCGCSGYRNYKPDDAMSKAICDVINNNDIYYQGKTVVSDNITYYKFLFLNEEKGQLEQIVNAANGVLEKTPTDSKIEIGCCMTLPGGEVWAASIKNFTDDETEKADFNKLYVLEIGASHDSVFREPSTYSEINCIKKIQLYPEIDRIAKRQDVDWYEYWPDLESIEVLSR